MASKVPQQLQSLPWPALVGASIVLHAGVLSIGLPRMIQVGQPGEDPANIPVTLVDDNLEAVPAAEPPVPSQPTTSATASPPTPRPVQPQQTTKVQQGQPIAQQSAPVRPENDTPAPTESEPTPTESEPAPTQPENDTLATQPPAPTPEVPAPETPGPSNEAPPVDNVPPSELPPADSPPQGAPGESGGESSGAGPTTVTIEAIAIPDAGNEALTQPNFSVPQALQIPTNHGCTSSQVPSRFSLNVEIQGNGQIISLRHQGQLYDASDEANAADCLLMKAISANPVIAFAPTKADTPFNPVEPEPGPSVQVVFDLGFK